MPQRAKTPCVRCKRLVDVGVRCPCRGPRARDDAQYDRRRLQAHARGYDHAWRKMRARVLAEQPICAVCRTARSTMVHHKVPLRQGGTHDRANLVGECYSCHLKGHRNSHK